jgi:hypothetical protein
LSTRLAGDACAHYETAMCRTTNRPRAVRAYLSLAGLCSSLLACAQVEPLDRRVAAGSMNELVRWQEKYVRPLGEPITSEFAAALVSIAQKTPGYKVPETPQDLHSPYNALCQRLDGMRLRDVIIEGYELTNVSLRGRLFMRRSNTNTMRVRMNNEGLKFERAIAWAQEEMKTIEDEIARNEARLYELRGAQP